MIDVTVSIVHASKPELTLECLQSLAEDHGRRSSSEIVVLDNASGDMIAALVEGRFPGVRVIEQHWRAGFGANHNTIIRSTASRYVFVLNPDTRVLPGAIDGLVDYLDAHPKVAIAGPLLRGFDGHRQFSALRLMTIPVQLVWALSLGKLGAVMSHRGKHARRVGTVSGSAMLIRREALQRVGLFDEGYFMYCEEADLAQRLERVGLERHYVPTCEVLHHRLQSTSDMTERRINEFWRSLELYLSRHHPPLQARILRRLTGLGYALGVGAAEAGRRLPERIRPATTSSWDPATYRLHVRNAFRGVSGPTLGSLAEEWNREHGAATPQAAERRR
jgi:N-acetylglucosaminyl-diphospho-decaprenol L-rhamnosyltransferase